MVNARSWSAAEPGRLTVAPVRFAVSTISLAERSISRWSYALSRMRMFWFAMIVYL